MLARFFGFVLVVAVLATLMSPRVAEGQVLISLLLGDKVSSEKFHLGLDVGLNLSNVSGIDDTKLRTGFFLGIFGEWRLARDKNWYLQPEIIPFYFVGAKNLPRSLFPPLPRWRISSPRRRCFSASSTWPFPSWPSTGWPTTACTLASVRRSGF